MKEDVSLCLGVDNTAMSFVEVCSIVDMVPYNPPTQDCQASNALGSACTWSSGI